MPQGANEESYQTLHSAASQPHLKLVGRGDRDAAASWARDRAARESVVRENRAAAANRTLDPADVRWVLAVRTQSLLQGTALTPERRERVLRTAKHLGVRPFDANLIIAIVQDHARRGESLSGAAPTLAMVRDPGMAREKRSDWLRWAAVFATSVMATVLMIRWVLGG